VKYPYCFHVDDKFNQQAIAAAERGLPDFIQDCGNEPIDAFRGSGRRRGGVAFGGMGLHHVLIPNPTKSIKSQRGDTHPDNGNIE